MNAPQKIAAFAAALAVVFAVALGLGALWGPVDAPVSAPADHSEPVDAEPKGAYTLELAQPLVRAGKQVPVRFRITDSSNAAITDYVESHEKQLHLIVVRRDLSGYQHVHPTLDDTGTWSISLDFPEAGDYRVFADFVPQGGDATTIGADLRVAGDYQPQPLPPPATTTTVDGYTVALAGSPTTGESSELTLSVSRDGKPVTDLQPYLGAYGHLVALRAADLDYLHVHPMGDPTDPATPAGPGIGFHTSFPSAGEYRLYLDFQHRDVVRTAEFTVSVPAAGQQETEPDGHGHSH
ncbi:hypothetical protein ACRCUN_16625 [Mycobacterium sp. LTG2003]